MKEERTCWVDLQNWKTSSRSNSYERPQNHSCYRTVSEIQDLVSFLLVTPLWTPAQGLHPLKAKGKLCVFQHLVKGLVAMEMGCTAAEWRVHMDVMVWAALLCIRELFVLFGGLFLYF